MNKKVLNFIKPYRATIVFIIIFSILAFTLKMGTVKITQNLMDTLIYKKNYSNIKKLLFINILLIFGAVLSEYFNSILNSKYKSGLEYDFRKSLNTHIINMPINISRKYDSADFFTRTNSDIFNGVSYIIKTSLFIIQPIFFLLLLIYSSSISIKLTLASIAPVFIFSKLSNIIVESIHKVAEKRQKLVSETNSQFKDMYDNIEIVKTYNLNDILSKKYRDKIEIRNKCTYDILKYNSILRPILISISLLPEVTGAIYGGYLVFKGEINSVELITFLVLLDYLLNPIHEFIDLRISKANAKVSIDRIFEILNSKTEICKDKKIEKLKEDMAVEIKDLNFSYVHNKKVLDKFNLNIKNKKSIGIVGASGSGKSTIINIICGFYPYESGQVKVFGNEVKDSDLSAIREHISLVTQDTYLYPISIYENLRYGRLNARDEEIIEAAKKANAHDFIMKLPEGYNTILTEGGRNLSGGQKQRLALARAILKDAPILLLDEPTSGLDLDAENIFIDALKNISKEKTIIIIAHRFSTLKIADEIVVLDNGEIVENGSYGELINNKGLFNEMYKKQFTRKEVEMC